MLYQAKLDEYINEYRELKKKLKIQQKGSRELIAQGVIIFNDYIPYLKRCIKEREKEIVILKEQTIE